MKILIVEDDEMKRKQVVEFLYSLRSDLLLFEARSLQSGLKALREASFDFLVVDMTMPTFDISVEEDGGRPQAYGGREILRHMKRRGIAVPSVVLTQFDRFGEGSDLLTLDELDSQLRYAHAPYYLGAVYYSVLYEDWKAEMELVIRPLLHDGPQE